VRWINLEVMETYRKTREIDCEVFRVTFWIFGPSEIPNWNIECMSLYVLRQLIKNS
jgi:hypothetical protein